MIIAPGDSIPEAGSSKAIIARDETQIPADDPPPSYTSVPHGQLSPPTPSTWPSLPKPSNFVAILKPNGNVKGSWTIDPTLSVPAAFLSPLVESETRKNLSVTCNNGVIDVDITVLHANHEGVVEGPKKRATVYLHTFNGTLTAKLHSPPPSFPLPRPSIFISLIAHNGHVNLRLPRSFKGPLTITALHGSVRFSPDVETEVTTFSEMRTKKCFIGDYSTWRDGEAWTGDEAVVEAKNGSVRIRFDDEVVPEGPKGPLSGIWAKLFGASSG